MTSDYEISVAGKIPKLAGVDLVRYANSGTVATMHAIIMARAVTGRNKVLKFEGCYRGFHDYTLWNCYPPVPGAGYRRSPVLVAHGSGIPHLLDQLVISAPYNDEEAVTGQRGAETELPPPAGHLSRIRRLHHTVQPYRAPDLRLYRPADQGKGSEGDRMRKL